MEFKAVGDYVIIEKTSLSESDVGGFQIVNESQEVDTGKVLSVGNSSEIVTNSLVLYFKEFAIALGSKFPNRYVVHSKNICAVGNSE